MKLLVNIDVADLARAETFHDDAFGFTSARRLGDNAMEFPGAGVPVHLFEKPAHGIGAGTRERDYDRHWPPIHLDVAVDDLGSALTRTLRAGTTQEGGTQAFGRGRLAQLATPFGRGWCLLPFLGHGHDEITT